MILLKSPKPSDDYSSEEAIAAAKRVLCYREDFVPHGTHVETQFVELDLYEPGERLAALEQALNEITEQCRRGPQPPYDLSKVAILGIVCTRLSGTQESSGKFILSFP